MLLLSSEGAVVARLERHQLTASHLKVKSVDRGKRHRVRAQARLPASRVTADVCAVRVPERPHGVSKEFFDNW